MIHFVSKMFCLVWFRGKWSERVSSLNALCIKNIKGKLNSTKGANSPFYFSDKNPHLKITLTSHRLNGFYEIRLSNIRLFKIKVIYATLEFELVENTHITFFVLPKPRASFWNYLTDCVAMPRPGIKLTAELHLLEGPFVGRSTDWAIRPRHITWHSR